MNAVYRVSKLKIHCMGMFKIKVQKMQNENPGNRLKYLILVNELEKKAFCLFAALKLDNWLIISKNTQV